MGVSKGVAQPLAQRVLSLVGSSKYQPLNKTELAKKLGVSVDERAALRKLLVQMESSGKITRIRKERYVLPQAADLITGVILINPQGSVTCSMKPAMGKGTFTFHRARPALRSIGTGW